MNRRDLVQKVVLGGTVLFVVPSVLQSCTKTPIEPGTNPGGGGNPGTKITLDLTLADNSSLNTAGGSKVVQSVLIVNTTGTAFIAVSAICTHQGCTVGYDPAASNIKCPCHGSVYNTTGSVITGPAPASLQSYPVSKVGNILTVSL